MVWDIHHLFCHHSAEIRRSLRRRGLTDDTAADLTQDTFLRLLTARPKHEAHNPRAYLFQIARNLLLDYYRRQRISPIDTVAEEIVLAVADPAPSPEKALYDKQRLAVSEKALLELPERTRTAFELHRIDGLTIAEVGVRIGLSTTQTWSLIRDAYKYLRGRLRDV